METIISQVVLIPKPNMGKYGWPVAHFPYYTKISSHTGRLLFQDSYLRFIFITTAQDMLKRRQAALNNLINLPSELLCLHFAFHLDVEKGLKENWMCF